ncbi:MAG: hypothetical protein ACRDIB_14800, partial [Ardenticatenaceae bacterium]
YIDEASTFFSNANPNLPKQAVSDLLSTHINTLASVVDQQAAGGYAAAYTGAREASDHMDMIASALTTAIVQQFPDQYGGTPAATPPAPSMPQMPSTGRGGEPASSLAVYVMIALSVITFAVGIELHRRRRPT